ncbi:neprilysin-1-like [Gigantopelta aegis]|uniref:neprilysin-1-like n=1 Tax=Gigantopelta aegis TaxID=1735272 RepID=UPI001B88CA9F|nr:neprilysin-1-like [Gigantopelta aegis]
MSSSSVVLDYCHNMLSREVQRPERIELLPAVSSAATFTSLNGSVSPMNGKAKYIDAEEDEADTRVTFDGNVSKRSAKRFLGRYSRLEVSLLALCLLLAAIVLVLIIVLALRSAHTDHDSSDGGQPYVTVPSKHTGGGSPDETETEKVCVSTDCVSAAARILHAMDGTVDPCNDFFEYACGNWNKVNVIPDDRATYNTFAKLRDDIQVLLKGLLEEPVTSKDSGATKKAKYLYYSCANATLINKVGLAPVKKLLEELGGWPIVLDSDWDESSIDLIDLIIRLRLYNNNVLMRVWVSADDKNSNINIIQIDQPDLGMPSRDYYLKGRDDPILLAYEKYARDVAIMFGANETVAIQDTAKLLDLEIQLANITIPQDKRRDNEKLYNRMTIAELQQRVPKINWLRYLSDVFQNVNTSLNMSEEVVVYAPEYLEKMAKILLSEDKRTLTNYMFWRIMMHRVANLPDAYKQVRKEYFKKLYGSETERSRWRDCVSYVKDNMGYAVGRLFVEQHFDEDAKSTALDMIHTIRNSFYQVLEEAEWMDDVTRVVAKEKADAMVEKIGYPNFILNNTELDKEYENVDFYPDRYFDNVVANIKSIALTSLKKLREPVDKSKWSTTPAVVNAFYSSTKNQIMFPAGILQPPFYKKGYPKSLNYGGIGMVIGHEITHGFDDRGRQFDKDGNLIQWWDDEVIAKFKVRAQCIIDQYSNFTLKEINLQVNGIQTQGENIADNGGLLEAYTAYRHWVDERGEEETPLPGLSHLSHNKLFFLNFAQVWCGTMRPEAAINRIRTGQHSPGRFRVIGTLQNSYVFAKTWNCPKNSKMNPTKKCKVW